MMGGGHFKGLLLRLSGDLLSSTGFISKNIRKGPQGFFHQCRACISLQTEENRRPKKDRRKDRAGREANMPVYQYNQVNKAKNRLYVFGTAFHGGIGLENLIKPKDPSEKTHLFMWKPVRHKFAEFHEMTEIVAGHGFSLFAIKPRVPNGPFIFGCGKNHASQLGYQATRTDGPMETLLSIVPLPFTGKNSTVLALGAGRAHSLVSVLDEGLFTLGDNSAGQCGRKVIDNEAYFGSKYIHKSSRFKDDDVVSIASRFDISVCVTKSGRVFTCGDNSKGQLGRGKDVGHFWEFQEVGGDLEGEKVKKVVTSGSSVLALTEKGDVFSWGCNEMGQVNPEEVGKLLYYPKHVLLPHGIDKVTDISIGDYFSFILNQQGNVYVWGHGNCLGLGPKTASVKTPTQLPPPLFGCNQFTPDVQVVSIASSFFYNAAINSLGDIYTWGQDINGCLGLGKMKQQFFPLRVGLGSAAKKVSLGIDHTLVIAKGL